MADIIHRIGIKAPVSQVYSALSTIEGLAGWWTTSTSGVSKEGGRLEFTFLSPKGDQVGKMDMDVTQLVPGECVRWVCRAGPADWIGTEFEFKLSHQDGMTLVLFAHKKWAAATESMAHCSTKWAVFLLSLRDLVEKGKGQPSPHDIKIDNWN
ncbi:MAG: SRPBCC domain-containing protein [Bdellovibrionaceae bacterium]|nr:SRPBCC domain-containing protein [Pseudobdellovibrionaceae bacterium]